MKATARHLKFECRISNKEFRTAEGVATLRNSIFLVRYSVVRGLLVAGVESRIDFTNDRNQFTINNLV
jgi:hypothetical protein